MRARTPDAVALGAAMIALAACAASENPVGIGGGTSAGAGSSSSGGHGGVSAGSAGSASSASSAGSGQGGTSASSSTSSSSGQGGMGGGDAGPMACMNGGPCTVDLRQCPASEEANAWKGQSFLQGVLELASYTTHFGWVCQVSSIPQAWPVIPEPGWWCGVVTPACVCSPSDQCK